MKSINIFLVALFVCTFNTACGGGGGGGDSTGSPVAVSTPAPTPTPTPTPTPVVTPEAETENDPETEQGSGEVVNTDYTPDIEDSITGAAASEDLYVEPTFSFNQFKKVTLNLEASAENASTLANKLVKIKALPDDFDTLEDDRLSDLELLYVTKLDASGVVSKQYEMPVKVKKVLVELSVIGVNNLFIVSLGSESGAEVTQEL
ncbi:hypothetical protein TDB9533_00936 [Thalassocella blandensis]|nr:hypothetical protein TDB9533_00936 [Thalassocella blandensis]